MRAQGHGQRLRWDGRRHAPSAGWRRVAATTAAALALALAPACASDDPADLAGQPVATETTTPAGAGAGAGAETLTSPSGDEAGGSDGGSGGSGGSGAGPAGGDSDDDSTVRDTLPKRPQEDEREAPEQPTVEIQDGRCTPRALRVPAQSSLQIRNRDRHEAQFDVPDAGTELEVPARGQLQALLPPGRHAYTCRVGGRTSRGTVTVAPLG